jgi:hypothetical protein
MSCKILTILFCFFVSGFLQAKTINVPADQPTIQGGIDAAADGDTVLVADSSYVENIYFKGKAITVASYFIIDGDTTHIDSTIIDGSQPSHPDSGSVVFFVSGEDTNSVICGFTITGGTGTMYDATERVGGGIFCCSSDARILHNKILDNHVATSVDVLGAGISSYPWGNDQYVIIEHNVIRSNTATAGVYALGGGICLPQGRICYNRISQNNCVAEPGTNGGAGGGGIFCASSQNAWRDMYIIGNTIAHNSCNSDEFSGGGGVTIWGGVIVRIMDNIINYNELGLANNTDSCQGVGIRLVYTPEPSVIQDNIISYNKIIRGTGAGGGIICISTNDLQIRDNTFEGNYTTWGGGIFIARSKGDIIFGNIFHMNKAIYQGGGIYGQNSETLICKNLFAQNEGPVNGGAIKVEQLSETDPGTYHIINNTMTGNIAPRGGGLYSQNTTTFALNNILWNNAGDSEILVEGEGGPVQVDYSDIQGGVDAILVIYDGILNLGDNNIDADPLFVDTESCYLSDSSPCVDAGDPNPIYNDTDGTRNDMGAYGGPSELRDLMPGVKSRDITKKTPRLFTLGQNYPNPFNPTTTIKYAVPKRSYVEIKIIDVLGREVKTLISGDQQTGTHQVTWNGLDNTGSPVASGVYFYTMTAVGFSETRKLLLLR